MPPIDAAEPLLIPDTVAARMASVGRSTWWRLHASAKTPAAVKLGRSVRWNRAELEAWIAAACPCRREWEAIKATGKRFLRAIP